MRISKDLAGQIAYKLTDKTRLLVEKIKKDYQEVVTVLYEAQTPQAVIDCKKKFPDWFGTKSCVYFSGHGLSHENCTTTRQIISNNWSNAHLELNSKIADKITKAKRKYDKVKDDYNQLKKETEQALINLGTYARIRENIPAAAPFLPPPISNALVCNFDSLNSKLKKQANITVNAEAN